MDSTSTSTTTTNTSSNILSERLHQLQNEIHTLIGQQQPSTKTTAKVASEVPSPFANKISNDHRLHPHTDDNGDDTTSESSSSFQLGMQLFGTLSVTDIEMTVQTKIQQYETELQSIQSLSSTITTNHKNTTTTPPLEIGETEWLQMKLVFLKECSIARSLLDESIQCNNGGNDMNHHYNHSNSDTTTTTINNPLVQSTLLLLQSQRSLQTAYSILQQQQPPPPTNTKAASITMHTVDDDSDDNEQQQQEQEQQLTGLYSIYDSIQSAWRRQKVHIITTMINIWDTSISHTTTSIAVVTTTATVSSSSKHHNDSNSSMLRTFFDVYTVLSKETNTNNNNHDNHHMFLMIQNVLRKWTYQIQIDILAPIFHELSAFNNNSNKKNMHNSGTTTSSYAHQNRHDSSRPSLMTRTISYDNTATGSGSDNYDIATTSNNRTMKRERRIEWIISSITAPTMKNSSSTTTTTNNEPLQQQYFHDAMKFVQQIFVFIADHILQIQSNDDNHAVGQYIAQRFFGNATTLASTTIFDNNNSNTTISLDSITTIDGKQIFHSGNIPRLGNDDDGLFIHPLLEVMEHLFIPQTSIEPKNLYTTLDTIRQQVQSIMNPFVQELSNKHIIPEHGQDKMRKFIGNIDQVYVSQYRCQLLNHARTLLLTSTDYHNTITVGTSSDDTVTTTKDTNQRNNLDFLPYHLQQRNGLDIFHLQKASISLTAHEILLFCRQIMDEVIAVYSIVTVDKNTTVTDEYNDDGSSNKDHLPYLQILPALLYRTAREVLDLYRMLIPTKYGYEIHNVPRIAAIHHNDAVYLAYHCSILGLEYKNQFPTTDTGNDDSVDKENTQNSIDSSIIPNGNISHDIDNGENGPPKHHQQQRHKLLRQSCVFVDMVPLFRDIAEKSINHMIQFQCQQIVELVGERISLFGHALKSNEIVMEWSDATEVAYTAGIYHIRHVYQNWLPPILSIDIFNRTIGYLIDVFLTLYLDQIGIATDISSVACPYVHAFFQKVIYDINTLWNVTNLSQKQYYSRVYDKFIVIGQFMNMSMMDIQHGLSIGMFRTVTGPELTQLIVSCFDDTPKRRSLLTLISSNP